MKLTVTASNEPYLLPAPFLTLQHTFPSKSQRYSAGWGTEVLSREAEEQLINPCGGIRGFCSAHLPKERCLGQGQEEQNFPSFPGLS